VEAAKAAIVNNRRQGSLQDSRIERAAAGIDQANAQIAAAQAGKEAVQADVLRTQEERTRQEALLNTHSTTQQKVETAIADERRLAAQAASREADLTQARTSSTVMNWRSKRKSAAKVFWNRKGCSFLPTFMPSRPDSRGPR